MFLENETFKEELHNEYEGQLVLVEYECNGVAKSAIGKLHIIGADYIDLKVYNNEPIEDAVYCQNDYEEIEFTSDTSPPVDYGIFRLLIYLNNVNAVELNPEI
ncbi:MULTISPECIES: hypothetical protein [unclassified Candidatus Frackibacter]|uniref:hypothetical protein n=1 Tax=unclassified Candidatus Frackibacter TaxID=2648818 RepID=UPI000886128A|nr:MULTISPECIES: hypothetical protein [unclassified Candidatus Frackibacter]SDC82743.1 hypothetical protein SAMN04515661_12814 [Candidatus Frackibacter sp. WG11]SEM97216.1 hypothetical protein SAMN04488698_13014 [Candidatus Frackibacter sp. WG12]SFM05873.1 hypothetical protein SAMN04488699_13014 [Candidatus Frackibacter sp. WG13]